jgi:hypothetical protein
LEKGDRSGHGPKTGRNAIEVKKKYEENYYYYYYYYKKKKKEKKKKNKKKKAKEAAQERVRSRLITIVAGLGIIIA